jgi:hypothetical protein
MLHASIRKAALSGGSALHARYRAYHRASNVPDRFWNAVDRHIVGCAARNGCPRFLKYPVAKAVFSPTRTGVNRVAKNPGARI